jgi:hypothetical protein
MKSEEREMFAIIGITGNIEARSRVGRAQSSGSSKAIRTVVRDSHKAEEWVQGGCEVAIAGTRDAAALAGASIARRSDECPQRFTPKSSA